MKDIDKTKGILGIISEMKPIKFKTGNFTEEEMQEIESKIILNNRKETVLYLNSENAKELNIN